MISPPFYGLTASLAIPTLAAEPLTCFSPQWLSCSSPEPENARTDDSNSLVGVRGEATTSAVRHRLASRRYGALETQATVISHAGGLEVVAKQYLL